MYFSEACDLPFSHIIEETVVREEALKGKQDKARPELSAQWELGSRRWQDSQGPWCVLSSLLENLTAL